MPCQAQAECSACELAARNVIILPTAAAGVPALGSAMACALAVPGQQGFRPSAPEISFGSWWCLSAPLSAGFFDTAECCFQAACLICHRAP